MSDIQTICPLHVQADQVSALYDGDLDAETAAARREHLATCDVCQRRLNDYSRISAILGAQTAPQPDARLSQGILAARGRGGSAASHSGWAHADWRSVAAAAAIIVIVGGFAGILLRQAASQRSVAAPTPTIIWATPIPIAAPPGWTALLPIQRHSQAVATLGLAVSRARPGRLVGCEISGLLGSVSVPYDQTLEISDDGGVTWQTSAIRDLPSAASTDASCSVVVDQVHPDTIIVADGDITGQFAVTTDAGKTWRSLDMPTGLMEFSDPPTLVNGHLIGVVNLSIGGDGELALGDLSIDGRLTFLDSLLPYANPSPDSNSLLAFAVDPTNASHLYVVAQGKLDPTRPSSQTYLFTSTDAGATWRQIHVFAAAAQMSLWAPTPGTLYAWISSPATTAGGNPLQQSVDGGVTWRDVTPADFQIGAAWFGPGGQVVLASGAVAGGANPLDELDPATGKLTPMGVLPRIPNSDFMGLVTGGADPQFLVSSAYAAFARPLP